MDNFGLVAPHSDLKLSFSVAPIYNILCSFCLLGQDVSGLMPWIPKTKEKMTPEELESSRHYCGAYQYLEDFPSEDFELWLDSLVDLPPERIAQKEFGEIIDAYREIAPEETSVPDWKTLRGDKALYMKLLNRIHESKGKEVTDDFNERVWTKLQDPARFLAEMVECLRSVWDRFLKDEWTTVLPRVEESVRAFESMDFSGLSREEILKTVTQREVLPGGWLDALEKTEELVFVPNPHIGPYLIMLTSDEKRLCIAGQALVPKGATVQSPPLSRSELMIRLSALSDDSRLGILELAAGDREITTADVMEYLDLSQSSASRHLTQLSATGFLKARSQERVKLYRLSRSRVEDTFQALKAFLFY